MKGVRSGFLVFGDTPLESNRASVWLPGNRRQLQSCSSNMKHGSTGKEFHNKLSRI